MGKERRKVIIAGSLWMAVQYTVARGGNQAAKREARAQISTPARESLNAKLSWQKLMLVLAANFVSSDLVVTLTYRDTDLPRVREQADKRLDYFMISKTGFTVCSYDVVQPVHDGVYASDHCPIVLRLTLEQAVR